MTGCVCFAYIYHWHNIPERIIIRKVEQAQKHVKAQNTIGRNQAIFGSTHSSSINFIKSRLLTLRTRIAK